MTEDTPMRISLVVGGAGTPLTWPANSTSTATCTA